MHSFFCGKPVAEIRSIACHMSHNAVLPTTCHRWTRLVSTAVKQAGTPFA